MPKREGNAINSQVFIPGRNLEGQDRVGPNRQLTFETISEWIRLQGFDEYTEQGLIDLAAKYPTSALRSFRRNFNLMIARVRQMRRQEQEPVEVQPEQEMQDAQEESFSESHEGFDSEGTNPVSEV